MPRMSTLHLLITGRVQGVGYRDWLVEQASRLHLTGWVRNAGHDHVEALISGDDEAVQACLQHCYQGPPIARVDTIAHNPADTPVEQKFVKRPSIPA